MSRRTVTVVVVVVLALLAGPSLAAGVGESTPGLAEAQAAAQQATQDYADAQTALGELDRELAQLEAEQEQARAEVEALQGRANTALIEQYVGAGVSGPPVASGDLNEQATADALLRAVRQTDDDAIEQWRAAQARLDAATAELEDAHARQEGLLDELAATQERLEAELARLQELERQRLAEEQRRAEEEARQAAEAAERQRAQDLADQLARQRDAQDVGDTVPDTPTVDTTPAPAPETPSEPVVPVPTGGGMVCPVPGSSFIDSFGAPRPQGWAHKGVDMMAPSGTPILAPVGGVVEDRGNSVGGNAFHLTGDDGRYYYGAHLSAYGQSGRVSAGTVIGYVGNTGDAQYTAAHLHLEIHIGGVPVNPYPYVAAVC